MAVESRAWLCVEHDQARTRNEKQVALSTTRPSPGLITYFRFAKQVRNLNKSGGGK